MHPPDVVVLLLAWITPVVGDASHVPREDLFNGNTDLSDSHTQQRLSRLNLSIHELPGSQFAGTADVDEPAEDEVWEKAICKGKKMVAQMSYSDFDVGQLLPVPQTTAQSPWSKADMRKWGYEMHLSDKDYCDYAADGYWGVGPTLNALGITQTVGEADDEWRALEIAHHDLDSMIDIEEQTYIDPSGRKRRNTGAYFFMSVLGGGGIIAQDRKSPWEAGTVTYDDFTKEDLPDLQRSSDIMWIMWEHAVPAARRKDIKIFGSLIIGNPTTLAVIARAMKELKQQLTTTVTRISMDTDQGKAILSTPNGAGFAHFLIQRKLQVGLKRITHALVFKCQNRNRSTCLIFTVEDLAAPTPRPKDDAPPKDPAGPSKDNPNDKEPSRDLPAPPGLLPPQTTPGKEVARRLAQQDFVRMHTFSLDERGNVTLSSSFY